MNRDLIRLALPLRKSHLCKHLAESSKVPKALPVKNEILLDFISAKDLKTPLSQGFLALQIQLALGLGVLCVLLFLDACFFHGGKLFQSLASQQINIFEKKISRLVLENSYTLFVPSLLTLAFLLKYMNIIKKKAQCSLFLQSDNFTLRLAAQAEF